MLFRSYGSSTASNVPLAANLTNNSSGCELAINIADGKLYYKDSLGVVQVIADKAGIGVQTFSGGTTGLTPATASTGAITLAGTLVAANGGTGLSSYTTGDIIYASGATTLSKLGIGTNGQALLVSGGSLAWGTASATTVSALTITTTGGSAAPATFNGSSAVTIDYSTVGADQAGTAVAMAIALG